ncbi:MAG: hypothetical protein K6F45_06945 [Saccharofermentans sp.]|jgi:hypothetical protein|nr:hypothetical protein [Saccharofermentans sp.]
MKKVILTAIAVIAVLLVLCFGYIVWSLNDYISKTPEISPKEGVVCVAGEEVGLEEMFDVADKEGQRIYIAEVFGEDGVFEPGISLSEDGQTVIFEKSGSYKVYCCGEGSNHEFRSAEAEVTVKEAGI